MCFHIIVRSRESQSGALLVALPANNTEVTLGGMQDKHSGADRAKQQHSAFQHSGQQYSG